MVEIKTIAFANVSATFLYVFFRRFVHLIEYVGAKNLGIERQFSDLLLPAFENLCIFTKKRRYSAETKNINMANKMLDDATLAIIGINKQMLRSSDKKIVSAAKQLEFLFRDYKKITRSGRDAQMSMTDKLLYYMNGEYFAFIQELGFEKLVAEMSDLYNKIDKYESLRSREVSVKRKLTAIGVKKDIVYAYRIICGLIKVNVAVEGLENYDYFIRILNTIICSVSVKRSSYKKKDKEGEKNKKVVGESVVAQRDVSENKIINEKTGAARRAPTE
jgi:hypothetical protein